jgi:protoporphyrinogen oxidase
MSKKAIIIGAGPAGLTAAYELLKNTDIQPVLFEATGEIGGISRTVQYKGNRMDIGGHRFFSKSDKVMKWWTNLMPIQGSPSRDDIALGRAMPLSKEKNAPDPEKNDRVMLVRNRLSRIFFLRKFFGYPVSLNLETVANLGFIRLMKVGFSYIFIRIFPIRNERTLEDFYINRFGRELYNTFFKDYTEKVWGVPCGEISKEWGAQRVKGLSLIKTLLHAVKSVFVKDSTIGQKKTETSLIEQFLYPKFGPGHLWEEAASQVVKKGGKINFYKQVVGIESSKGKVTGVRVRDAKTKKTTLVKGDHYISTMPVRDLVAAFGKTVPVKVKKTAEGLTYRDFITVGLLLDKMKIRNKTRLKTVGDIVPDTWIYIQERDVKVGRLQIFNNWSPYLVKDPDKVWIGLEYFCNEGDGLWKMKDKDMAAFAAAELEKIDIIDRKDVVDATVIRVQKTYPAYFGTYADFPLVREFTDSFENLYLVGRNGMHRYNNMDHSMLTAMTAVENIIKGVKKKDNIWAVNTEEEYHEKK